MRTPCALTQSERPMFNDLPARYLSELAVDTRSNCLLRQPVIGARMSLAELMRFALDGATYDDLDTLASYPMVTKRVHAGRLLVTCTQSLDRELWRRRVL